MNPDSRLGREGADHDDTGQPDGGPGRRGTGPGPAVRAITEALTAAGLPDARVTAAHEDGRLVVTVTGADPGRVRNAVAGFALTVRSGPPPAAQTTSK